MARHRTPSAAALRRWAEAVHQGALPRRDFIARLAAWGVSAPLAGLLLQGGTAQAAGSYKPTRRGGGGLLKILMWQGPTLLNPHFATGAKDADGCCLFYEPLFRYDPEGLPAPLLAAQIPSRDNGGIAADGRSVTWKLKQGVTWHDGKPFTADDVVFNWRYATDPATAAVSSSTYENVKAVEKIDTHTVRVVFERPSPAWTRGAEAQLVPKHVFEAYAGDKSREAPANMRPVGTGPYRFVEFKPGDLLRGTLNPSYHQPTKPHFDTIEIKGGGDPSSAARAVIQTGEYDFAWNLQVEDEVLKRMEASGKGSVQFSASGAVEFILFNFADPALEMDGERASPKSRHPVLTEPGVRQALALLFDRKSVQDFVYGRTGIATTNFINNPAPYNSPNTKAEFSVDKANAVLDAAGWKRGAGGVREKGGRQLKLLLQTSINPVRQKVQQIYKQACAKAGIELELKGVTSAVFFGSDVGNPDTANKFWADLQMLGISGRAPDPSLLMLRFVSWELSSKANKWQGRNVSRWVNPEFDRLFQASEAELDPAKRIALLIRMNDILSNELALIPVVYRPIISGAVRKLVAPVSGWDVRLGELADWYRDT
jgi:peptide/nickel transport system substrate-binding protein